ncbi:hypothetical protein ACSXDC_10680 [Clostridium perfringens]
MKKGLVVLLSAIMISASIFIGCDLSNKSNEKNNYIIKAVGNEVVSSGELYNEIISVYKNVDVLYDSQDSKQDGKKYLIIKIKLTDSSDEIKLSNEFNEISKNILKKIEPLAVKYENLQDIVFEAEVNDKELKDANIRCYKSINSDNKIYYEFGLETESANFKEKTKEEKEEEDRKVSEAIENFKKIGEKNKEENKIVEIPSEPGYFKAPNLLDNLEEGKSGLSREKASFELKVDNDKKIVKVRLIYKNQVLIVGIVNNIRNNIVSALGKQCDEIDLTIIQENPTDLYECKYTNGAWDKEVK